MKGISTLFVVGLVVATTTAAPRAQFFANLFGQSDTTTTTIASVGHLSGNSSDDVSHSSDEQINTTHPLRITRQISHPLQPFGAQGNETDNESRVVRSAPGNPFGSVENDTDSSEDHDTHSVSSSVPQTHTGLDSFHNFRTSVPVVSKTEDNTKTDGSRFARSAQFFSSHATDDDDSAENSTSSSFVRSSGHETSRSDSTSAFSGPVVPIIRDLDSTSTTTASTTTTTHSQRFRFKRSDSDEDESGEVTANPEEEDNTHRPPVLPFSPQASHQ